MAKNRIVNTKFWTDSFVLNELNPVEKLVFLYLITNPYTDICGVYELPIKIMALETGIDRDNLEKVILPRLEKDKKILYRDGWVAVKNFIRHQVLNPKVKKGICDGLFRAPKELQKFVKRESMIVYDSLSDTDTDTDMKKNAVSSFKKTKRYYNGQEMRFAQNKWWVIPRGGGEWLEFVGSIKDTEVK